MKLPGYIKRFGGCSFEERPFGQVDSVIFALLSYLKWEKYAPEIAEGSKAVLLSTVSGKEILKDLVSSSPCKEFTPKFYRRLASSKRFNGVSVNYFSSNFSSANPTQFAAVTFFLPSGTGVIAYRGTDATTTGWREDFNMALFDVVPSQTQALKYLNKVTTLFSGRFYITGHSKGGNLALYAATHMSLENKERLIMARSHDGPGFRDVDSHIDALIPILKKVSSTVPQNSVIGALLGFKRNSKIIRSKAFFLLRHNPFSWVIDPKTGDYVYIKFRNNSSLKNEVAIGKWISGLNEEEKMHMVDLFFLLLDPSKNGKVDFFHRRISQVMAIKKRFKGLNVEDQKFLGYVFRRLYKAYDGLHIDQLTYKKTTIFDNTKQ